MKIFHFSDTHLWINLENTTREEDFYKNFKFVIDKILEIKPNIVIHSWDLFHTSKPSNKAISVVVENFLKLEKTWIKIIIIAWNHDTPRISLTTHPFEIFKSMNNFYVFFKSKIENIEIFWINLIVLPHIHDENIFKEEFNKIQYLLKDDKKNIFISHFWISSKDYDWFTDEISWVNISLNELKILKKFDYVALWHYHKQFCIWNICYPGSIEHTSFNQKNYKIWYNIFDSETWKKESFILSSRSIIDLWIIDVKNIETTKKLIEFLENNIDKKILKDAIVKIILNNITNKLMLEFDEKLFLNFFSETFYFEYRKIKFQENKEFNIVINETSNIILDNFERFFNNYNFSEKLDKNINKEHLKQELIKDIINY